MPGKPSKPVYVPKEEVITKPLLADFKRRIDTVMEKDEIKRLLDDKEEWLNIAISQEQEVEALQKVLNTYLQDIEDLSKANIEMKEDLRKLIDSYDSKMEQYT